MDPAELGAKAFALNKACATSAILAAVTSSGRCRMNDSSGLSALITSCAQVASSTRAVQAAAGQVEAGAPPAELARPLVMHAASAAYAAAVTRDLVWPTVYI